LAAVGLLLMMGVRCVGQDAAPAAAPQVGQAAAAAAPAKPEAPAAMRKFRGRLPAYFSSVVSSEQRQKIYDIQATYFDKISALELQIADLRAKQDQEVNAVLSADQAAQVQKLRDEASTRRRGRTVSDATAGTGQG
jgi:hypothetical protein